MLTREKILGAPDVRVEEVPMPEWDGTVRVRTLTAADRLRMAEVKAEGLDGRIPWLIACCVDESGAPLFTPEDAPALAQRSAAAIDRLFEAVDRLNTVTAAAVRVAEGN